MKKKVEDSNKTTTWYIRDASGNIMATYDQTNSQFNGINTKKLLHSESPLYGSSRLGNQNFSDKLVDFQVEYIPDPNTPVIMANRIMQDVVIAELQYDSPATGAHGVEEHFGEYFTLYNKGEIALPLDNATVYSKYYQNERLDFPSGMIIEPKQTLIVAFGTQNNQNDFILLNDLEGSELSIDTTVAWFWQTSLRLHDVDNRIILSNTVPSIATGSYQFTIADLVDYHGTAENTYDNDYYDANQAQYTSLRTGVQTLRKKTQHLSTPTTDYFNLPIQFQEAVYNLSQLPFNDTSLLESIVFEEFGPTHEINKAVGSTLLIQQNAVSLRWPTTMVSTFKRERGLKVFELSNHLGNVLVTVSDKKIGVDSDQDGTVDYYEAEVTSANDYYPFGWSMPGRQFAGSDKYRFGFNGKENDSEWGSQVIQDYGFRIYNPSIGKFLSVDPLTSSYPELTPYQFASNRPIDGVDLDGLEYLDADVFLMNSKTPTFEFENKDGTFDLVANGCMIAMGVSKVEYSGKTYYNIGEHIKDHEGNKMTEWIYEDIDLFSNKGVDPVGFHQGSPSGYQGSAVSSLSLDEVCSVLAVKNAELLGTDVDGVFLSVYDYNKDNKLVKTSGTYENTSRSNTINVYSAFTETILDADNALDYIHNQLENGNAVVVGVSYGPGGTDNGTNHWITIVGREKRDGEEYFFFIENATRFPENQTSHDNRIVPGTGKSTLGGSDHEGTSYETTRIQLNKKKP